MSSSAKRRRRCTKSIESLMAFMRKDDSAADALHDLSGRFLCPSGILEASSYALQQEGLTDQEALLLSLIPDLARYTQHRQFGLHPKLATCAAASQYIRPLFTGIPVERFYLLCLDNSGRLIQCALLREGTYDETPFYIGDVLQCAITTGAQALVICHNHPGGTLRPSQNDVACTMNLLQALYPLRIPLLDHLIAAGEEAVSMRNLGFAAHMWIEQCPESKLLLGWFDPK